MVVVKLLPEPDRGVEEDSVLLGLLRKAVFPSRTHLVQHRSRRVGFEQHSDRLQLVDDGAHAHRHFVLARQERADCLGGELCRVHLAGPIHPLALDVPYRDPADHRAGVRDVCRRIRSLSAQQAGHARDPGRDDR